MWCSCAKSSKIYNKCRFGVQLAQMEGFQNLLVKAKLQAVRQFLARCKSSSWVPIWWNFHTKSNDHDHDSISIQPMPAMQWETPFSCVVRDKRKNKGFYTVAALLYCSEIRSNFDGSDWCEAGGEDSNKNKSPSPLTNANSPPMNPFASICPSKQSRKSRLLYSTVLTDENNLLPNFRELDQMMYLLPRQEHLTYLILT